MTTNNIDYITHGILLIRGLPGSGKSTLARRLVSKFSARNVLHVEADMYFVDGNGQYNYDRSRIREAHNWCKHSVNSFFSYKKDGFCIVSNTFVRIGEMSPYYEIAAKYGVPLNIHAIPLDVNYGNVHGVPDDVLIRMKNNFEE